MLFCTIRYTEFWSLFENVKICVVSYHMLHGVLVSFENLKICVVSYHITWSFGLHTILHGVLVFV